MAFQSRNLSVLAYANGFTLWHYVSSEDMVETIFSEKYFTCTDLFSQADHIHINSADGSALAYVVERKRNGHAVVIAKIGA